LSAPPPGPARSRPSRGRAIDLAADFYSPGAVEQAVQAFSEICTLRIERTGDRTRVASPDATERDLLEFANYALALSVRMRRETDSGSTKTG